MNQTKAITIAQLPKIPSRSRQIKCNVLAVDKSKVGVQSRFWTNHFEISLPSKFKSFSLFSLRIVDEKNEPIEADEKHLIEDIGYQIQRAFREKKQVLQVRGLVMWIFNEKEPEQAKTLTVCVDGHQYHVQMNPAKNLSLEEALRDSEGEYVINQMLNVLVKGCFKEMGYVDITKRQQYFRPNLSDKLKNLVMKQFYVWQGFPTSVRMVNSLPMLCVDTKSKVLRNETALDRMRSCKTVSEMAKALIGESVTSDYGQSRTYRIHEISQLTPASMMDATETFAAYLLRRYKLKVKDMDQYLLVHDPMYGKKNPRSVREKVFLVPEFMRMTGLTDRERAKRDIMKELAVLTKINPANKRQMILDVWKDIDTILSKQGLTMEGVEATGVVLYPPQIKSGTQWADQKNPNQIFTKRFHEAAQLTKWAVVYCSESKRDDQDADDFVNDLIQVCTNNGMKMTPPIVIKMKSWDVRKWCDEIAKETSLQLVVCCLDKKGGSEYQQLKQYLSCDLGVPSQCMTFDTYFKNKKPLTVAANIAKQINSKLGKAPYLVQKPAGLQRTMLVGIDVFHRTSSNQPSWAGFISTIDEDFSLFHSQAVKHHRGEELVNRTPELMGNALKKYVERNQKRPETIIVYRDGVGEGQVNQLLHDEINGVLDLFAERSYTPNFIVILVNKRIAKRYFDGNSNPKPGSIIVDQIVQRGKEFLLVPQNVTEGTATPTLFRIIANNSNLSQETIWQLTYWQCYNYSNWAGPVRVPSVCQYAHKAAYAHGDTLQREAKSSLSSTLYHL